MMIFIKKIIYFGDLFKLLRLVLNIEYKKEIKKKYIITNLLIENKYDSNNEFNLVINIT